ncbi:MAG: MATE family efflux transporter [Acidobacteriota bacterium]|nr:MATE family efflux transporter [Acidobacteriota bacterium]MDH3522485.1 MATE family efflux transporter [Acidobacteriota bacterium]
MTDAQQPGSRPSDPPAPALPALGAAIRAAIAGSPQDFTAGPIGRAVLILSVPMMIEMVGQSIFGIVDILFVGRVGEAALAAVGLTESLLYLVFSAALGLAMATAAFVARRIGERKPEEAAHGAFQALVLGLAVSLPFAVTGVVFAPSLLRLLGAEAATVAGGSGYTAVVLGGSSTVFFLFLINAVFRGAGDATLAMKALWLANGLNVVLDPLLIFGWGPVPALGVTGAGVATTLARAVGVAYQLRMLARGAGRIRLTRAAMRLDGRVAGRLARVAVPGVLQFLVGTCSWLAVIRIVALFGNAAVAGYTIAGRILVFALMPSWGMANAAATLVGQNLGAGRPRRAERSVRVAAAANLVFLGIVGVLLVLLARPLVEPFSSSPEVVRFGADCVRIVSYSYLFFAVGMVVVQAFNGAGDTWTPTWINFLCYWVFELPLAYVLAKVFGLGAHGVFWSITAAQGAIALVGVVAFRRGRWRDTKL